APRRPPPFPYTTLFRSEPLPNRDFRNLLLFYEAAEGGAGVLRQLASDPTALPRVATQALQLCHFDPETGADLGSAPGARERCSRSEEHTSELQSRFELV